MVERSSQFSEDLGADNEMLRQLVASEGDERHPLIKAAMAAELMPDWINFKELLGKIIDGSEQVVVDNQKDIDVGHRKIVHRIWISSPENPVCPPEDKLRVILRTAESLSAEWTTYFWVQDPEKLKETVAYLSSSSASIYVRSISELWPAHHVQPHYEKLVASRKYALACDLLRMELLNTIGGIYADLGVRFSLECADKMIEHQYSFIYWKNFFFQTSLMSARPNSSLIRMFFNYLSSPNALVNQLVSNVDANAEVWLLSGPIVTVLLIHIMTNQHLVGPEDVFLLHANGRLISWSALQSWYTANGNNNFGNVLIKDTLPTILHQR